MDINPQFTAETVANFGAERLIHGHTHKQAVHICNISSESDRLFTRIVLGDWGKTASILAVDENGFAFNETR